MSTPTSTSFPRKRKADVDDELVSGRKLKIAKPSPSSSPAAHLPASCLAAILNFMEYGDVRRCLLAGKIMAVDAAKHIEVLNIMNASELVPSAAGRFVNVAEINILSLVTSPEGGYEDALSVGTATRSVLFLTSFPKLKRVFLGGLVRDHDDGQWSKFPYSEAFCVEPEDHLFVFRGLVDHLCGAFQSRSLSPSLRLHGVFGSGQAACNTEDGHRCRRCWNVATSFPLDLVLENIPMRNFSASCLSHPERIEALATRHDNPFLSQSQAVTRCFLAMTNKNFTSSSSLTVLVENRSFVERIKSQGGEIEEVGGNCSVEFWYIFVDRMKALKRFAAIIGPTGMSSISKSELLSAVRPLGEMRKDGKKPVLVRQTFESLVQLGFDLASTDFVLFDPLKEKAYEGFHDRFRSEEEAS